MIHELPKPDITPAFTVDDIHKIREWDYERLKDATPEERRADTERRADRTRRTIEELRRSKIVKAYPTAHNASTAPRKPRRRVYSLSACNFHYRKAERRCGAFCAFLWASAI